MYKKVTFWSFRDKDVLRSAAIPWSNYPHFSGDWSPRSRAKFPRSDGFVAWGMKETVSSGAPVHNHLHGRRRAMAVVSSPLTHASLSSLAESTRARECRFRELDGSDTFDSVIESGTLAREGETNSEEGTAPLDARKHWNPWDIDKREFREENLLSGKKNELCSNNHAFERLLLSKIKNF